MSQANGLEALFQGAVDNGALSQGALTAIDIQDIGADINAALGISVDDVRKSEVTLFSSLIDDSGSIRFSSNTQVVRDGHNLVLDALNATKTKGSILAMCRYLNGTLLYPYVTVDKATRMDTHNYDPNGGTPLYEQSIITLAAVLAKSQEFEDNGVACRTVTAIVTDGADSTYGRNKNAADVKKIVTDMLRAENHIIAGMGIWDGQVDANKDPIPGTGTDFKQVFSEMGIPEEWILTPKNSPSEIRKAFQMLSQSASRASQAATTFSQTAMGGFGG